MARSCNFKEEYKKYQDGKYELLTDYINAHTKCIFKCNDCNLEFEQSPNHHKKMKVCPCSRKNEITDIETIKEQIKQTTDGKYTLLDDSYHSSNKKAKFICNIHGVFTAIPYKIIAGRQAGCKLCGKESFVEKKTKSTEDFIKESVAIHGNTFDYTKTEYISAHEKVIIICPSHGEFKQTASNHLKARGCPKCGDIRTKAATTLSFEQAIKNLKEKHGALYEYPEQEYKNNKTKIRIICPTHGEFKQSYGGHLQGQNCPKCANKMSKPQLEIAQFITDMGIKIEENYRGAIPPSEIDIWIPEFKIGIEFNGLIFHREGLVEGFGTPKPNDYHLNKTKQMESKGYRLIHLFEDEWMHKKEIVKSKLKQILKQSSPIKINARECEIKEIDYPTTKDFLEGNHIQGKDNSKYRYGLYHQNILVAVMTFLLTKGEWKLNRYATLQGYSVRGGASKLLKFFEEEQKPEKLVTFADRRFSIIDDNLYKTLGFDFKYATNPNYFYMHCKSAEIKRYSRVTFQRHKLPTIFEGVQPHMTEKEIMVANGYDRIWDCGHLKYEKTYY